MNSEINIEDIILNKTHWSDIQKEYAGSMIYEQTNEFDEPISHTIITRDYSKISVRHISIREGVFDTTVSVFNTKTNTFNDEHDINSFEKLKSFLEMLESKIKNKTGIFHPFGTINTNSKKNTP